MSYTIKKSFYLNSVGETVWSVDVCCRKNHSKIILQTEPLLFKMREISIAYYSSVQDSLIR